MVSTPVERLRRPYRDGRMTSLLRGLAIGSSVVTVVMVVGTLVGADDPSGGTSFSARIRPAMVILLLLGTLTLGLWASTRPGIRVSDHHVEVRTEARTRLYAWTAVTGFDLIPLAETRTGLGQRGPAKRIQCVRLLLADEHPVVTPLNSTRLLGGDPPAEVVRRLEASRPS